MQKVLWMVLVMLTMAACSGSAAPGSKPNGSASGDTGRGPAVSGGAATSAGSCVEQYSPETLKNRQLALDGVVTRIVAGNLPAEAGEQVLSDESVVTLRVNKWYKGGSANEITLKSSIPLTPVISSTQGPSLEVGKRYLVSGDAGFMWSCGFSTAFSDAKAAEWAAALG